MAQIDVSDLLNDPDFVNPFTVVRRTSTPNDFGENIIADSSLCAIGSIQAGNGDTLMRLPEAARKQNAITVYTKTELKADGDINGYSDIIIWNNQRYQVLVISPWGNYGAGWFMCDCIMEKASI